MTIEREERLQTILELVQHNRFRTQRDLVVALRERGVEVTQSSVSRDIRDLGLRKQAGIYVAPKEVLAGPAGPEVWGFAKSIDHAGDHLAIITCQSAMAQAIAAAIDEARWPGIVGTIAGDDTVFVAVRDSWSMRDLLQRVRTIAEFDPDSL